MSDVEFKSEQKHFDVEESGLKPNTVREVDWSDERFWLLNYMIKKKAYGRIKIKLPGTFQSFERQITDVTFWKSFVVISWKHEVQDE